MWSARTGTTESGDAAITGLITALQAQLPDRARQHAPLLVRTAVAEHARRDTVFGPADVAVLDRQALALLSVEFERIDPGAPWDWPAISALAPHVGEVLESSIASRETDACSMRAGSGRG
jgi:hypothetical protein